MSQPSTSICDLPAATLAAQLRAGALSAVEVVEAHLARIAQVEPHVQAWVHVDAAGARAAARALDDEYRTGRVRGPLHGVPVALKDIFDAAGLVTTSGAAPFAHRRPEVDAPAVAVLRAAGAVVLGKTTTTEFAYSDPTETRNPWNLAHTPGGSSAGSAAAVAARMVPLALGSQTIGSTLRPAAYCGVVGFKPTYGLVSTEGVTPLAWSLDHVGIFGRTVEDVVLVLAVLTSSAAASGAGVRSGRVPGAPGAAAGPAGGPRADAHESAGEEERSGGVEFPRLGLLRAFYAGIAMPEVTAHLDDVAETFAGAGATVEEVALPPSAADLLAAGQLVLRVEAAAYHRAQFERHADAYRPKIRRLVEDGLRERGVDYVLAQRVRAQFRQEMAPLFARFDALLLPVAPAPAPPRSEGTTGDPVLCAPWSFCGFPAIALPAGLSRDGLPLGIQLVAGQAAEAHLLDVARWCEARLGVSAAPPLQGR
ncbi:MAG: amidase [Armatimonadota bacterium]|nr:amidase [Armatimonadota bacterium]